MSKDICCILPWIHIASMPTGEVKPCCLYDGFIEDESGQLLNLKKDTISDAWDSPTMERVRDCFIRGDFPPECESCRQSEEAGKRSKREIDLDRFKEKKELIITGVPRAPEYLDLKLGNICNIKCRICSSDNSSAWFIEDKKFSSERADYNIKNGDWPNGAKKFWDNLSNLLPEIRHLDFTGGEPFLIKSHIEFLRKCCEHGYAKDISIHYNTNGTVYPQELLEEILPHFKFVEVMVSIDGVEEQFEYLRHPAKWEGVTKNIDRFIDLDHIYVTICNTPSAINIYDIDRFVEWALALRIPFWFNPLHFPAHFNLQILPAKAKQAVEEKMIDYLGELDSLCDDQKKAIADLIAIINYMKIGTRDGIHFNNFVSYLKRHDDFRGESFENVFLEWSRILNWG